MFDFSAAPGAFSTARDVVLRPSIFEKLRIEHGPPGLLGRFFLAAQSILGSLGIRLVQSSLSELSELQATNVVSWPLIAPMLDPSLGGVDPEMSYGFVGVDPSGRIACAQGGRIYSSGDKTVGSMIDDHSFIYGEGRKPERGQPVCWTTAPASRSVRGVFAYSGGLWVHPEHRGHRLAALLPRISRAYALTRWGTTNTVGVVSDKVAASPLMARYGYKTVQSVFGITNIGARDYHGVFLVLTEQELLDDLAIFLAGQLAQVDAGVSSTRAEHEVLPVTRANR